MKLLTCQEALDFLSDYVEGRLSAAEIARMDEHLTVCPQCIDYLANFKAALAACRTLRASEFEKLPEVPEELVHAILAARREP